MKKLSLLLFAFLCLIKLSIAQEPVYQLSSHILDITAGKPAANVKISLSKKDKNDQWMKVEEKFTDANGRIKDFLKQDGKSHFQCTVTGVAPFPIMLFVSGREILTESSFLPIITQGQRDEESRW